MRALLSSLRHETPFRWICRSCAQRYTSSSATSTSKGKLPIGPARTRFAPSPTGYLHLGSLRTALFNYLLAKATGGQFLLRIEDTDQKRTIPDALERLCQDLEWAGLNWDEGPKVGGPHGPYIQSQRTAIYREHAERLLKSGSAYRCFCSPDRLYALAKQNKELGHASDYDRTCTHVPVEESEDRASKGEAHVIRLKVPEKYPEFRDLVYGLVKNKPLKQAKAVLNPAYEDPILLKSDGFPTYHLANVVDDRLMEITHVVRGAEWMSSTPKHLALYEALGWQPPQFAHVGLLMDQNGQKLSKRNLDIDISSFRDKMGILPEALINYVALLGWSHGQKKDFMTLEDLISNFSTKFTTGDTVVTFDKLWFLQKTHAANIIKVAAEGDVTRLPLLTQPILTELANHDLSQLSTQVLVDRSLEDYVEKLLALGARGYSNAPNFVAQHKYFFYEFPTALQLQSSRQDLKLHNVPKTVLDKNHGMTEISTALKILEFVPNEQWTVETVKAMVEQLIHTKVEESLTSEAFDEEKDIELTTKVVTKAWSHLTHSYIRWATANSMPGPASADTLVLLGRSEALRRLQLAEEALHIETH